MYGNSFFKKCFYIIIFVLILVCSQFALTSFAYEDTPYTKSSEGIVSLDGKTVYLVGNSMLYYGNCALYNKEGEEDNGYFKELTKLNNENTSVIDHTYSGRTLRYIYNNYLIKVSKSKREKVDYVVLSEHTEGSDDLVGDVQNIMDLFPDTTKFLFSCHFMIYDNDVRNVIEKLEDLRKMGVEIVNWGKLVYDIYSGAVSVPYAVEDYTRSSFVKDNVGYVNGTGAVMAGSKGDRKHPNLLSGYITALSLYTAITNRSAVAQQYDFCSDSSIHKYYDFDAFISSHYNGTVTTNFDEIFASEYDMAGLQQLINEYNENEGRHALTLYEKGDRKNCTVPGTTDSYMCVCCGEVVAPHRETAPEKSHSMVAVEAVPATCTSNGVIAHYKCTNKGCEYISSDKKGTLPLTDAVVKASGHTLKTVKGVKATCENDGNILYYKCTNENCGKFFSDKKATAEVENVTLLKTGHKLVYVKKVSATCTEKGNIAHYKCTNEKCNSLFSDKKGKKQIVDIVIEPTGHKRSTLPYVASSCTKTGLTEGEICSVCNKIMKSQNVIKKQAHKYKNYVVAATFKKAGTVTSKCSQCGYVKSTKAVAKVESVKLKTSNFVYDGKAKSVTVTVKDRDGNVLKENQDYYLKYLTKRKEIGKHGVKVVLKGNYSGTQTLYYNILPGRTSSLTVEEKETSLKAQWKTVAGASAYRVILYSSDGKKIKTGYTTKNTYKFKDLAGDTDYKIKVTTYKKSDGSRIYSASSKTVTAKTLASF